MEIIAVLRRWWLGLSCRVMHISGCSMFVGRVHELESGKFDKCFWRDFPLQKLPLGMALLSWNVDKAKPLKENREEVVSC